MSILDNITALKVGRIMINKFNDEMSKKKFSYQDFQELQNDYEKILANLLNSAYNQGKNDVSYEEFKKWLDSVSAYDESMDTNLKCKENALKEK